MIKSELTWLLCISTVVAVLALLVVNMRLSRSCYGDASVLFCLKIPQGDDSKMFNYLLLSQLCV